MLLDVPWIVWVLAFGPGMVIAGVAFWGRYGPQFHEQGRYARSWYRWTRAVVVGSILHGPTLLCLFIVMLASSNTDMAHQRHHALQTISEMEERTSLITKRLEKIEASLVQNRPILQLLELWEHWYWLQVAQQKHFYPLEEWEKLLEETPVR